MCIVKTPKVDPATNKPKDPTVIRNPYLDGVGPLANAARSGRSSLRITRTTAPVPKAPPMAVLPPRSPRPPTVAVQPGMPPVRGGGGTITREVNEYVR